jgi:hypothetical protein
VRMASHSKAKQSYWRTAPLRNHTGPLLAVPDGRTSKGLRPVLAVARNKASLVGRSKASLWSGRRPRKASLFAFEGTG